MTVTLTLEKLLMREGVPLTATLLMPPTREKSAQIVQSRRVHRVRLGTIEIHPDPRAAARVPSDHARGRFDQIGHGLGPEEIPLRGRLQDLQSVLDPSSERPIRQRPCHLRPSLTRFQNEGHRQLEKPGGNHQRRQFLRPIRVITAGHSGIAEVTQCPPVVALPDRRAQQVLRRRLARHGTSEKNDVVSWRCVPTAVIIGPSSRGWIPYHGSGKGHPWGEITTLGGRTDSSGIRAGRECRSTLQV